MGQEREVKVIYFALLETGGIKIGFTKHLARRFPVR
jgi:hypothetical protein